MRHWFRHSLASVVAITLVTAARPRAARADDLDLRAFEYLDVSETTDGSVWKGVIVEQTPNVQYKLASADGSVHVLRAEDVVHLSKERNRWYRFAPAPAPMTAAPVALASTKASPPRGGVRVDPELGVAFPTGVLADAGSHPGAVLGVRVGYEYRFGSVGVVGGAHLRFADWQGSTTDDGDVTLAETHLYARGVYHAGHAAPYAGLSLGSDHISVLDRGGNVTGRGGGFGMNLQLGVTVELGSTAGVAVALDYHPGTDEIVDGTPVPLTYVGLTLALGLRF